MGDGARTLVQIAALFTAAHSIVAAGAAGQSGLETIDGRDVVVLESPAARLEIDLAGGSIGQFRWPGTSLNPLSWSTPTAGDTAIHAFGHFLCLDRWGPPSAAEEPVACPITAKRRMSAGALANRRLCPVLPWTLNSPRSSPWPAFPCAESFDCPKKRGVRRARRGHKQQSPRPNLQHGSAFHDRPAVPGDQHCRRLQWPARVRPGRQNAESGRRVDAWPEAADVKGKTVNLRELKDDPNPNVVSFAIEEKYGWITAATPDKGLLIGYVWLAKDYPWVSVWRDVHDGEPAARGLEFGTTGLHQPFPVLVEKGRIWDRPLFDKIHRRRTNQGQTLRRISGAIPSDFSGVQSVEFAPAQIILHERKPMESRTYIFPRDGLIPE